MFGADIYRAQVDTPFVAATTAGELSLRLVEVDEQPVSNGMEQFSLLFHGPAAPRLPQGTYELRHEVLGSLALFLVAVQGSNHERTVYEACFSQAVTS